MRLPTFAREPCAWLLTGNPAQFSRSRSPLLNPAGSAFANHREMQSFLTAIFKRSQTAAAYLPAHRGREVPEREDRKPALKENKGDKKMAKTLSQPAWVENTLRLDPMRFPQQATYRLPGQPSDVTISLDERGAVLRKILPASGLPLSIALPSRAFKGVAARAIDHGDGEVTVTLELHHDDPDLCIPLLVAHDLSDIAADWRAWAEAYRTPMLMVEADGVARPLEEHLGEVRTRDIKPRRRHSMFKGRRPRFLMRRATGSLGVNMKIAGREIIARS